MTGENDREAHLASLPVSDDEVELFEFAHARASAALFLLAQVTTAIAARVHAGATITATRVITPHRAGAARSRPPEELGRVAARALLMEAARKEHLA